MSPIKREHRDRYAENWSELTAEIKAANGHCCQCCQMQCRKPGEPFDTHKRTLTISHYFHDYTSEAIFVACLCAPCHIRHDAAAHAAARQRTFRRRRLARGQMSLIPHRDARLSAYELAELERAWPGQEYLESLPDGIDRFAQFPVEGLP